MECSGGRAFQREDRTHTEGPGSGDSVAGGVGGADRRPRHFTESQQNLMRRTVLRSGLTYNVLQCHWAVCRRTAPDGGRGRG